MRRAVLIAAAGLAAATGPAALAAGEPHHPGGTHGGAPAESGPGAPAPAGTLTIGMRGRLFSPSRITVLAGERVTWVNDDSTVHDVGADAGGGFDSGRLAPGASYARVLDAQGTYRYRCTLHRFMSGTIDVFALALAGPSGPVPAGRTATLSGRAPDGTSAVSIEALDVNGGAWRAVAEVPVARDGTFAARPTPARSATYRARAGELSSAPTRVGVAARLTAHPHRMGRASIEVQVSADPAQPGAAAVLQRYDRERFDWRPVARGRLDARSRATLRLRSARRERLRVVLPRGTGGFAPAASPALRVPATS